ncbi:hypothetical protein K438DRAFT_1771756 [Mycena galopus ATCC 62051]|nr:hypothetical protein K438DRAFT_1771756 [Mycena galopus ATCC 62051]
MRAVDAGWRWQKAKHLAHCTLRTISRSPQMSTLWDSIQRRKKGKPPWTSPTEDTCAQTRLSALVTANIHRAIMNAAAALVLGETEWFHQVFWKAGTQIAETREIDTKSIEQRVDAEVSLVWDHGAEIKLSWECYTAARQGLDLVRSKATSEQGGALGLDRSQGGRP